MAQSDEQIAYAAYVKEATDEHREVLPFGRWKTQREQNTVPRPS